MEQVYFPTPCGFSAEYTCRSLLDSDEVSVIHPLSVRLFIVMRSAGAPQKCDAGVFFFDVPSRWTLPRTLCVWALCSSYTLEISTWTSSFKMTARAATCRQPGSVFPASTSKRRSRSKRPPEPVNSDLSPDRLLNTPRKHLPSCSG